MKTQGNEVSKQRRRGLIFPREHGAWGMLLVPLVTGGAIGLLDGGRIWPLALLAVVAFVLFWLRTPLESWLGTSPMRTRSPEERRLAARALLILGMFGGVTLITLFWNGAHAKLLWIGLIVAATFAAQALLKKSAPHARAAAQLIGALGLTCTAPAAYYVVTGHLDTKAWILWLVNWLFAGDQIRFVQLKIRSARAEGLADKLSHGLAFLIGQTVLACMLALICYLGLLPWLALLAFVPVLVRGLLWFVEAPGPLIIRRLGWMELTQSVIFGILLVSGFHLFH